MEAQTITSVSDVLLDIWNDVEKETTLHVSGRSMWPLIEPGDQVLIKHTRRRIRPGMLIAFRQNNRIIVHRVVRAYSVRNNNVYVCRGDHNGHLDRRVQQSEVIGKVNSIVRNDERTINVANPYWRVVGRLVVQGVNVSRLLPLKIGRHRFFRFLGLALLRSACVK